MPWNGYVHFIAKVTNYFRLINVTTDKYSTNTQARNGCQPGVAHKQTRINYEMLNEQTNRGRGSCFGRFNIYPLTGLTLNNWNVDHGGDYTRVGADFGAGFDIYLTSTFKLSLQGKYSLMDDCSGGFFNIGFGYVF